MLILSRRLNESVILTVGEIDIELKVVKLSGDTVKLGFEAPQEVAIVRNEIIERNNADDETGSARPDQTEPRLQSDTRQR